MKVLIIGDVRGLSEEEAKAKFKAATDNIRKICEDEDAKTVAFPREDAKTCEFPRIDYGDKADLLYLGLNVFWLHKRDAVYFIPGWERDPECRLVHQICNQYKIQIIE